MECFSAQCTMEVLKMFFVADKWPSKAKLHVWQINLLQKIESTVAFMLKGTCISQQDSTGNHFYVTLMFCKSSILGHKYLANKQQCSKCFVCTQKEQSYT